jgi:hypothetical protein
MASTLEANAQGPVIDQGFKRQRARDGPAGPISRPSTRGVRLPYLTRCRTGYAAADFSVSTACKPTANRTNCFSSSAENAFTSATVKPIARNSRT